MSDLSRNVRAILDWLMCEYGRFDRVEKRVQRFTQENHHQQSHRDEEVDEHEGFNCRKHGKCSDKIADRSDERKEPDDNTSGDLSLSHLELLAIGQLCEKVEQYGPLHRI